MLYIIVISIVLILATLISMYFLKKKGYFKQSDTKLYVISGLILILGILVVYTTDRGPMQAVYISMYFILILLAIVDFYSKEIHLELFICVLPLILINMVLFLHQWDSQKLLFTGGTLLFIVLIGILFRKSIGFGDILLFVVLILAFELEVSVFLIILAFTMASIYGLMLFALRRTSRGTEIAFTPFIFISYMIYILL